MGVTSQGGGSGAGKNSCARSSARRTAVTARIRDAIRRIGEAHPDLARHLARTVRTGTFCSYEPDHTARWSG